jgi:hypothetical protein
MGSAASSGALLSRAVAFRECAAWWQTVQHRHGYVHEHGIKEVAFVTRPVPLVRSCGTWHLLPVAATPAKKATSVG